MEQKKAKSRMPQLGEAVFCIGYLVFDLIAAVIFFVNASDSQVFLMFGVLTLSLAEAMRSIWFPESSRLFTVILQK